MSIRRVFVDWRKPAPRSCLMVDSEPMYLCGQIDRIDVHEVTQKRIIFDYKTGDTPQQPDKTHRRQDAWIDLRLPLYRHLVKDLGIDRSVQLGYILLPKSLRDVGACMASWSHEE